jgi:hypothetical protein
MLTGVPYETQLAKDESHIRKPRDIRWVSDLTDNVSVVHDAPGADRQGGEGVSTALAFATRMPNLRWPATGASPWRSVK